MHALTRTAAICLLATLACFAIARRLSDTALPRRATAPQAAQNESNSQPAVDTAPLLPQLSLDELLKPTPPKEPAEALKSFETIPGFHMELVAHEPDVVDPVAAAFDEDGHLFVAEMRDYPFRPADSEKPTGRIRMLTDTDGDGRYDRSTTYADDLLWPTGVVPWKQGVFVAAAPNIYYFKDTDGDGVADERRVVFSGFGTQNEQGSVNNLAWGLDGKIYASSSKNGGQIRTSDDPAAEPVTVAGRDFCFDPAGGPLELVTGGGQFGNAFDDWGNRFLCDESDPSIEVMLPYRYLARNPLLAVPNATNDLCPGVTPVFRVSPIEGWRMVRSSRRLALGERSEKSSGASHHVLDGTAGLMIYRGDAYPPEFRGNLIVGDGQTNLVHRRRLVPDGVTFESVRADANMEFVRSTDIWFRPVNSLNSPDGCVYLTDMAREVIESVHVPWDVVGRINLKSQGRGRIYRVAPDGFQVPAPPRLSAATTDQLVATLAHRNGWWRDTAQRLLRDRQDPAAAAPLRKLVREESFDLARLHALYTLAQFGLLADDDLQVGLSDQSAGVREHAVRLSESRLADSPELLSRVVQLAADESPRVRFQVAFSLGEVAGANDPSQQESAVQLAVSGLATVGRRDGGDVWIRTAILSSSRHWAEALLRDLAQNSPSSPGSTSTESTAAGQPACDATLVRQLAFLVARDENHDAVVPELLSSLAERGAAMNLATWQPILLGLSDGLRGANSSLHNLRPKLSDPATELINRVVDDATRLATNPQAPSAARNQAIAVLSCGEFDSVAATLSGLLALHEPEATQRAAIQSLATFDNPQVAEVLIAPWRRYTPPVRTIVMQALFAHPVWLGNFVMAVERGDVPANQVTRVERGMLLAVRNKDLRSRAEKLFEVDSSPRQEVYDRYKPVLELAGTTAAGEKIYQRECMACHQIGKQGQAVGPNLALTKHRTPEELLLHILDPNREVQPAFIQYSIIDTSGAIYSGLIAAETASSITLRRDKNIEQTVLKSEIEEMASSDKSLMPEGFEKTIPPQDMADLLAFLKDLHYDIGTSPGRREGE